jgi:hypothetical protein
MLTVITPATTTRLTTVARVREEFPSITEAVASDGQVTRWIDRASAMVVQFCNRSFAQETVRQTEFPCGVSRILLERTPATDLTVTLDGTALVAGTDYHHDAQRGALYRLSNGRPCVWNGTVQLDYKGGYVVPGETGANLPGDVEYAVQLWCASFVSSQSSATSAASGGLKREVIEGVGQFEYYQESTSTTSSSTSSSDTATPESLLAQYRRIAF